MYNRLRRHPTSAILRVETGHVTALRFNRHIAAPRLGRMDYEFASLPPSPLATFFPHTSRLSRSTPATESI